MSNTKASDFPLGLFGLVVGVTAGFTLPIAHWIIPAILYSVCAVCLLVGGIRMWKDLRNNEESEEI
ncbi:MAG: hypothetical protein QF442_03035 [Candidatus Peribacteraceae bacterium]|jgi:hypothetical protein|nr:hypothetical protein [Candidatus Peribacteraceae bacterium]